MNELKIKMFLSSDARPSHDGHYLAYINGSDHAYFLEYESEKWYKSGVMMQNQNDVLAWGIVPRITVQEKQQ